MVLVCKEQPSLGLVMEILSPRRVVVQHKSPILALILRNLKVQSFLSQYLTNLRCPTFWKLCATRLKQKHYFQGVFYFIPGMLRFSKYLLSVFPFIHLPDFNWKVVSGLANFLYQGQHITHLRYPTFWNLFLEQAQAEVDLKDYSQGVFYFIPGMLRFLEYLLKHKHFIYS